MTSRQKGGGRPLERVVPIKRVTLEMPQETWDYITAMNKNRTQWILEAIAVQRDLPTEVREELERRSHEVELSLSAYIRLLLIYAALRLEQSTLREWATARGLLTRQVDE